VQRKALNTTVWGFLTSNAYLCKSLCKCLGAAQDILLDARHLWFSLCCEHPSNFSQQLLLALQQTPHICQCLQWCKEPAACISTILLKDEEQSTLILPQQVEWKNGPRAHNAVAPSRSVLISAITYQLQSMGVCAGNPRHTIATPRMC